MKKYIILFLILSIIISGCSDIKIKKTTLEVVDNNRYYYPILQGQELDIVFAIKNTGDVPFILSDIFTSCGCLIVDESSIEVISPKKEGKLTLKYDSNKNVGNVEHYVTLYGNTETSDKTEILFNLHVIPNTFIFQNTRLFRLKYGRQTYTSFINHSCFSEIVKKRSICLSC